MLVEISNKIDQIILNNNFDKTIQEHQDTIFIQISDLYCPLDPSNITKIKFIMFDRFEYNLSTRPENIKKLCEERCGQNEFRKKIISRDKHCIITLDDPEISESAHIIPYSESKSFDISNGLLLNRCFHKMFDQYKFSINSNGIVEFCPDVLNSDNFYNYKKYHQMQIGVPDGCDKYLSVHYKRFSDLLN